MQTRETNYKDLITSWGINKRSAGVMPEGVYHGFDTIDNGDTGNVLITHVGTGLDMTEQDNDTITENVGVIQTKQGFVLFETEGIQLPIVAGGSNPRIDIICVKHQYSATTGGAVGIYEVVKGVEASVPTPPTVSNLQKRVIIGYLRVDAGATNATGWHWQRVDSPVVGYDILNLNNQWQGRQRFKPNLFAISTLNGRIDLGNANQIFSIHAASAEDNTLGLIKSYTEPLVNLPRFGSILWIQNTGSIDIELIDNETVVTGYRNIRIPLGNTTFYAGAWLCLYEALDNYRVIDIFNGTPYNVINKKRITPSVADGIIVNGKIQTGSDNNVYNVALTNGQELSGFTEAFEIGTEIQVLFTVDSGEAYVKTQHTGSVGSNFFKDTGRFDFVIKNGSIAKFIQTATGVRYLSGLKEKVTWFVPALHASASPVANSFKCAITPDNKIQFRGALQVDAAGTAGDYIELFTVDTDSVGDGVIKLLGQAISATASGLESILFRPFKYYIDGPLATNPGRFFMTTDTQTNDYTVSFDGMAFNLTF